jgi:glycosyltransferase involved in cell wall biosynthesis
MNILLTVDPEIPVPPGLYGGIERIIEILVNSYVQMGHSVTLCANPKSKVPCILVPWKGLRSQHATDIIKNSVTLTKTVYTGKFDVIHSFSRLAYMTAVMPLSVPKIMSYGREPSLDRVTKAMKFSKKNTMAFTGCSDYITDQIKPVAPAYTVYNCIPFEKYTLTSSVSADAPLSFLGRVEFIKGTHLAIEVAQKTNRRLIIAGNVPDGHQDYFDQYVKPHLNERITYVGPVNDIQKNELLGQSLAFLMPIQWNEPFGMVMTEAMACGTPVIGFPRGGVPEVIENDATGYLVNDVAQMIDAVSRCTKLDRRIVRERAAQRFSIDVIVSDYLRLYEKMIR